MHDDLSSLSSGIDSVTPFPRLEDDIEPQTPIAYDNEHLTPSSYGDRPGQAESPSTLSDSDDPAHPQRADSANGTEVEQVQSPSIEIQEDPQNAESQSSQYFVENESLEDTEDISLDSAGDDFIDEDDEVQDDESSDDDEDDDVDAQDRGSDSNKMREPFMRSTSSLSGPNAFAPPFYNRPPTPLPPSPSLTSLLRPPFSTTTSRPTTPDTSDAETPNDTEAAVAKSARTATTVPRASPKVPTYEYYGFVLYLTSSCAFCTSFSLFRRASS